MRNSNIYIKNGQILYDEDAIEARERAYAEKSANELSQLIGNPNDPDDSDPKKPNNPNNKTKSITVNFANLYAKQALMSASGNARLINANVANLSVIGADANTSANAKLINANVDNASTVGLSANANASANLVNSNFGNISAQGACVNASANVSAVNLAAGNVSATGAEAHAGVNVKGVNASVGNASVTGASAGANLNVTGSGVSAFNTAIGGPSAAASVNISSEISFGNVNIGLTPTLDIGYGLNLGIPFLSAGGGNRNGQSSGSGGVNSGNGQSSGSGGENSGNGENGERGFFDQMIEKYPNRTYELNSNGKFDKIIHRPSLNIKIEKNDEKKPLDDITKSNRKETCESCEKCQNVVDKHEERVEQGMKFVGIRGMGSEANAQEAQIPTEKPAETIWSGKYFTDDPEVAAGYAYSNKGNVYVDENGQKQPISRGYLPNESGKLYYTNSALSEPQAEGLIREVVNESKGEYVFAGPQDTDPDLRQPEFVVGPKIVKEIVYEPSAHTVENYELTSYHDKELGVSKIVPDFYVNPTDTKFRAQRDFDASNVEAAGRYIEKRNNSKSAGNGKSDTPMNSDDKNNDTKKSIRDRLLIEELSKKGYDVEKLLSSNKKKSESNANSTVINSDLSAYLRNRCAKMKKNEACGSLPTDSKSKEKKEKEKNSDEEEDEEKREKCADHPEHITCMNCLKSTGNGKKIKKLEKGNSKIYGFEN